MKKIVILGSTGSIGTQTLDVARGLAPRLRVAGLSTHSNLALLKTQIREFRPSAVAVGDGLPADELRSWCKKHRMKVTVLRGAGSLEKLATRPGTGLVLSSVVGSAGLSPLLAAIRNGTDVALANKEALVVAGDLVMREAKRRGVAILPVDSEHSAIFQCLQNACGDAKAVRRILLTASGGPFYRARRDLASVTVDEALAHPTWRMGPKITVDSATLMNKGLEAIEAHHLFGVPMDRIEIVIHPQSIVHSLVEFVDGSVLAQLSNPDMRLPIQYALTWPGRQASPVRPLDLASVGSLEFGAPDFRRFPCLGLALRAGRTGGTMPAVMNAANETVVRAFLERRATFGDIPAVVGRVMASHTVKKKPSLDEISAADVWARATAERLITAS